MPFETPAASFSWESLPDIQDVRQALKDQAKLRAELKIAKLELEQYQAWLTQQKPRDSSVKLVGIDVGTGARLSVLLTKVVQLEGKLDDLDADVKFNDYRLQAAKIMGWNGRV